MTGQMMPDRPPRPFRIPKKIAMINDIAGYGRCSTTVSLPIISARISKIHRVPVLVVDQYLQVQVCPVPTSIFSNHTGFPVHFMHDCTDILPEYLEKWRELELTFDGIYCGFLGSVTQIGIVKDFLASQTGNAGHSRISADGKRPIVILDPVMGDHGRAYRTITPQHCEEMKELLTMADIITPNITEACLLTGAAYRESGWTAEELKELTEKLHSMGPDKIVITGMQDGDDFVNFISVKKESEELPDCSNSYCCGCCRMHIAGESRPGTGDIFASVIAADAVNGVDFFQSVEKAAGFVRICTQASSELDIPREQGVCFENFLYMLV
jgi:pyridoxine kinase